jgi:hypothetical protein
MGGSPASATSAHSQQRWPRRACHHVAGSHNHKSIDINGKILHKSTTKPICNIATLSALDKKRYCNSSTDH